VGVADNRPMRGSFRLLVVVVCVVLPRPGRAQDGPCDDPPHNQYERWQGQKTCYFDAARKKKYSVTQYEDGKEVGPSRTWRDDGSLASVHHFRPNVSGYATSEDYYETGGIRHVQFEKPGSTVTIDYRVSGRIYKLSCLPGKDGGYAYSIEDCQPKVSFDIGTWKPSR
jgi:hypothetical protein